MFVRDGIQFVLHVNSSYTPGDEAVFAIQQNNIGEKLRSITAGNIILNHGLWIQRTLRAFKAYTCRIAVDIILTYIYL